MRPLLIGLAGKAGVGKDTAGHFFHRNYYFELYAFAWPLKSGLEAMFDLPPKTWTREYKEVPIPWIGKSPRELMQTLGTEWGRRLVRPDLWTLTMQHRWDVVKSMDPPRMCVTDVRFDDEAEAIRNRDGIIIHVVRPGVMPVSPHVSEAGISPDLIDFTLLNDGDLQHLEGQVAAIMERLTT